MLGSPIGTDCGVPVCEDRRCTIHRGPTDVRCDVQVRLGQAAFGSLRFPREVGAFVRGLSASAALPPRLRHPVRRPHRHLGARPACTPKPVWCNAAD